MPDIYLFLKTCKDLLERQSDRETERHRKRSLSVGSLSRWPLTAMAEPGQIQESGSHLVLPVSHTDHA